MRIKISQLHLHRGAVIIFPNMPSAVSDLNENLGEPDNGIRRLVLCFDGTGNKFQANESDTNIVKIYQMLQKNESGQYHYYQR